MIDSTCSNNCTPQQKLRKISFHTTDFDEYLNSIPNMQSENVEGWGNQTWNLKNNNFSSAKTKKKSCWFNQDHKNTQSPQKSHIYPSPNNRTKYIEKLEEKLLQIVNIKKERQTNKKMNETTKPHYLTEKKQTTNEKRTTSTSESEQEKFEHNFTSMSLRKEFEKSSMFKIRKASKQFAPDSSVIKINNPSTELKLNFRTSLNRSMLTQYEPMNQPSKEISIIPYPIVCTQRKPRVRRLSKLQDFKQTFYLKHNPELSLQKQTKNKNENNFFKIKVSQPKTKEQKKLKLKI